MLEVMGDYEDRCTMAADLGYPRQWDTMHWDLLYARWEEYHRETGMPLPKEPQKRVNTALFPSSVPQPRNLGAFLHGPSQTGAASTHDFDFQGTPGQTATPSAPSNPQAVVFPQVPVVSPPAPAPTEESSTAPMATPTTTTSQAPKEDDFGEMD